MKLRNSKVILLVERSGGPGKGLLLLIRVCVETDFLAMLRWQFKLLMVLSQIRVRQGDRVVVVVCELIVLVMMVSGEREILSDLCVSQKLSFIKRR